MKTRVKLSLKMYEAVPSALFLSFCFWRLTSASVSYWVLEMMSCIHVLGPSLELHTSNLPPQSYVGRTKTQSNHSQKEKCLRIFILELLIEKYIYMLLHFLGSLYHLFLTDYLWNKGQLIKYQQLSPLGYIFPLSLKTANDFQISKKLLGPWVCCWLLNQLLSKSWEILGRMWLGQQIS